MLVHRTSAIEQFLLWQCIPSEREGFVNLTTSLFMLGGMTVILPIPLDLTEFELTILIDRIERMFWQMHGAFLADPV